MSLIETYEKQYAVLTAEITSEIGQLNGLSKPKRKEAVAKVNAGIEEIEEVLEQIGLEIRDVNTNAKTNLVARHKCYEVELVRLKQEFESKKLELENLQSTNLYDDDEDSVSVSIKDDQRQSLLDNSERIERTGNRLTDGYRAILETENIGTQILNDLSAQRETIQKSRSRLYQTNDELHRSSRIVNFMMLRTYREKAILIGVVAIFILVISVSIYLSV